MIAYFNRVACSSYISISKKTVLAYIKDTNQYNFVSNLDNDQWNITSFDPNTRIVCASLESGKQKTNFTLTLPIFIKK